MQKGQMGFTLARILWSGINERETCGLYRNGLERGNSIWRESGCGKEENTGAEVDHKAIVVSDWEKEWHCQWLWR